MPAIWQRHPRYFLILLIIISTTFFLLNPYHTHTLHTDAAYYAATIRDDSLPARVERSEQIYTSMLHDRKKLIKKYGPTPSDIVMFPPDKDPWPAYTVWSFLPASFQCPHEVERIGSLGDGGKWTCGLSRLVQKPDCVIYTFGMNYETSFEAEILERTRHCEVWGYDYRSNSFGAHIKNNYRAHFYPFGLANVDKLAVKDENKLYTLKTLMEVNKHTYLDILKIDIEGWEFDVLTQIITPYIMSGEPLPFGQLHLEIHTWEKKFSDILNWWEMLEKAGLRPFSTEPNLVYQNYNKGRDTDLAEYSFLNIKGSSVFLSDPETPEFDV